MGQTVYTTQASGSNVRDAYNTALEDAREEHGHEDGYSGAINSAVSNNLVNVTDKFKTSKKSIDAFIDDYTDKNDEGVFFIELKSPIANTAVVKSTVEHIVEKGTKKWIQKFEVRHNTDTVASESTKGEAVKKARAYVEKHKCEVYIRITRVLEKGSAKCAIIKYKPSSKEQPGKWLFFGWART